MRIQITPTRIAMALHSNTMPGMTKVTASRMIQGSAAVGTLTPKKKAIFRRELMVTMPSSDRATGTSPNATFSLEASTDRRAKRRPVAMERCRKRKRNRTVPTPFSTELLNKTSTAALANRCITSQWMKG